MQHFTQHFWGPAWHGLATAECPRRARRCPRHLSFQVGGGGDLGSPRQSSGMGIQSQCI